MEDQNGIWVNLAAIQKALACFGLVEMVLVLVLYRCFGKRVK